MLNVVVVGRRADILPFRVAGAELVEVRDAAGAQRAVRGLLETRGPCVLMLSEELLRDCAAEIALFRREETRAVLSLPRHGAEPGLGLQAVRARVVRALGVDLVGGLQQSPEGVRRGG